MKEVKVLVIDPGKYPEFMSVSVTNEMLLRDDSNNLIGINAYEVAKKLIVEFSNSEEIFVERFTDSMLPNIGFYVDEDGRTTGVVANRRLIMQDHRMIPIAGRLVIIPDKRDFVNCEILYDEDMWDVERNEESLKKIMQTNWDDGSGPIVYLSQEESDNVSYNVVSLSKEEFNNYMKHLEELARERRHRKDGDKNV